MKLFGNAVRTGNALEAKKEFRRSLSIDIFKERMKQPHNPESFNSIAEYHAAIRSHMNGLEDAIQAASDESELNAVDVETGWPA